MRNLVALGAILMLLHLLVQQEAAAATVRSSSAFEDGGSRSKLVIVLEGEIVAGDAQKVENEILAKGFTSGDDSIDLVISLNSQGGSFAEGVALAKLFHSRAVGTYVADGNECLSACAVAFMGGTRHQTNFKVRDRTIATQARLGFHAPSLLVANGDELVSSRLLEKAYSVALETIGSIIDSEIELGMSRSLIQSMVSTPPDDMYVVDTVNDLGRWEIDLEFIPPAGIPGKAELANLCLNYSRWESDRAVKNATNFRPEFTADFREEEIKPKKFPIKSIFGKQSVLFLPPRDSEYEIGCYLVFGKLPGQEIENSSVPVRLSNSDPKSVVNVLKSNGNSENAVPGFAVLPPATKIMTLPAQSARFSIPWKQLPNKVEGKCRVFVMSELQFEETCTRSKTGNGWRYETINGKGEFQVFWDEALKVPDIQASKFSPEGRFDTVNCMFDMHTQRSICFQY